MASKAANLENPWRLLASLIMWGKAVSRSAADSPPEAVRLHVDLRAAPGSDGRKVGVAEAPALGLQLREARRGRQAEKVENHMEACTKLYWRHDAMLSQIALLCLMLLACAAGCFVCYYC